MNNGKDVVKRAAVLCLGIGLIVTGVNFSTYAEQERSEEEILTEELQNYYKMRLSGFNSQYKCMLNVQEAVQHKMKRQIAKGGVKNIRVHDLRHPYVKPTTKNISLQKQKS